MPPSAVEAKGYSSQEDHFGPQEVLRAHQAPVVLRCYRTGGTAQRMTATWLADLTSPALHPADAPGYMRKSGHVDSWSIAGEHAAGFPEPGIHVIAPDSRPDRPRHCVGFVSAIPGEERDHRRRPDNLVGKCVYPITILTCRNLGRAHRKELRRRIPTGLVTLRRDGDGRVQPRVQNRKTSPLIRRTRHIPAVPGRFGPTR